jgi:DNA-binding transcriptional MerR regulator
VDQFRIAELAERTGFSRPTLRYYEEIGLLAPERSDAGYRIYDRRDEERLRFIGRAKRLGLSLEEIGSLVAVWAGGECAVTRRQLRELVEVKIESVRVQVEESVTFLGQLEAVHDRLDELLRSGQSMADCECVPELPHVNAVRVDHEGVAAGDKPPTHATAAQATADHAASAGTNRPNQPKGQAMTNHTPEDLTGPAAGCGCGCGAPTTVLERPAASATTSTSSCGCGCAADADQPCGCGCDCCG